MFTKLLFAAASLAIAAMAGAQAATAQTTAIAEAPASAEKLDLPLTPGPFQPEWKSLENYHTPDWFRDAKFGIWGYWGPQSEPEHGDGYAREVYTEAGGIYQTHLKEYGHPSVSGFKGVAYQWRAENFDPDTLMAFYKENGVKYFMAMGNYHDNFDNWNSPFQPWNSVHIGPHKDIVGLWAAAAKKEGLRFGVGLHAARAWEWYEPAQGADKSGPMAGVPYDGNLTKADGKGTWWEGLDPQYLYAQYGHKPGTFSWDWDPKVTSVPDAAYITKFYLRTKQLVDDYRPDLIYFDDRVLPFHSITDQVGLTFAAHYYNASIQWHGSNQAVMNCKFLSDTQRKAIVDDLERGRTEDILPQPWQTDTPITIMAATSAHDGDSALVVDAGVGASAPQRIAKSDSWNDYHDASGVKVAAAGVVTVTVRPADPANWKPVNLAAVTLKRTGD